MVTEVVFQEEVSVVHHGVSQPEAEAQGDHMNLSSLKESLILKVPMLSLTKMKLKEN